MTKITNKLQVQLGNLILDNPVIPASGTFGFGEAYEDLYDLNILGSIAIKGTTKEPRNGNSMPRIAECSSGMLNAVGLENPGVEEVVKKYIPHLTSRFQKPLVANISGFSLEEYIDCAMAMDREKHIGIIEVNISCPNVHGGGLAFGADSKAAAMVTKAVKESVSKPVYIKLSPNVTDIVEIAFACQEAGADGLSLINTLLGMRLDLKNRQPLLANETGGLSGPAVFPVALRMVYQVCQAVNIPVMGMGGIASAKDVIEMMMAGASAVQIGTANLVDPWTCPKIIEALPIVMKELGIASLEEIKGVAL